MSLVLLDRFLKKIPLLTVGRTELPSEVSKKWQEQSNRYGLLSSTPKLSVIISVQSEDDLRSVRVLLESLKVQSYQAWEAILIGSSLRQTTERGPEGQAIRSIHSANPISQSEAYNLGASAATGEWLIFLGAKDRLSPVAFYLYALEMIAPASPELLYSHEVIIDSAGNLKACYSKSEFSWFTLLHGDYLGRAWWVKARLFEALSGFSSRSGESFRHDFLLRVTEKTSAIAALPYYLLYREDWPRLLNESSELVIEAHLRYKKIDSTLRSRQAEGERLLDVVPRRPSSDSLISVVVCFRDKVEWTKKSVEALIALKGEIPVEILLVDNESSDESVKALQAWRKTLSVPTRWIGYQKPFNFADQHNEAIKNSASGEYLLLLNNDVFLKGKPGDLDLWVSWAAEKWVGTVGIRLEYPDGRSQHSGLRAYFGGGARLARVGNTQDSTVIGYLNHEVYGNTFAACVFRAELFRQFGGLDSQTLANGYGDVDFNFKCRGHGLKNLYLGGIIGVHLESASRGENYEYWEEVELERKYPETLQKMLRFDLGWDRIPEREPSFKGLAVNELRHHYRYGLKWLNPLKPLMRKGWSRFQRLTLASDTPV